MATPSQASIDYLLENKNADVIRQFEEKFGEDELKKHLPSGSYAAGVARSVGQGLTFGFADELTAGAKAFFKRGSYEDLLDEERRALHRFREENPEAYAYEIAAGFAIPGVGLAKGAATAAKVALQTGKVGKAWKSGTAAKKVAAGQPMTAGRAAGVGAGYGGLYGVGAAEGDLTDRAIGGAIGATVGAPLSVAGAKATDLVGRFQTRGLSEADKQAKRSAKRLMGHARKDVGDEARVLASQGKAPTEAYRQTLEEMGPEAMLADVVGPRGRRFVAGLTHGSGEAGAKADEVLLSRASAEYDRVTKDAARLLGARADADRMADVLDKRAQSLSKPLYKAAEEGEGSVLNLHDFEDFFLANAADFQKAYRRAATVGRREGSSLPPWKKFIEQDKEGDFLNPEVGIRVMQRLKQGLDDMVETGRKGSTIGQAELNSLKALRNQFSTRLGEFNPKYAAANKVRSVGYRIRDAVDLGKATGKMEEIDVAKAFRKLTSDEERMAFRSGMLHELKKLGRMETVSLANKIMNNREIKAKLRSTFPDEESFNQFMRTLTTESKFRDTLANVGGGSRTARTLTDVDEAFGISPEELVKSAFGYTFTPEFEVTRSATNFRKMITNFRNKKLAKEASQILFTEPGQAAAKLDQLQRIYTNLSKADQKLLNQIRRRVVGGATRTSGLISQAIGP